MKLVYLVIAMLFAFPVYADMDCLDDSHHLAICTDYKELHEVKTCLCPCEKRYEILPEKGQCSKCRHYRKPRELVIIRKPKTETITASSSEPLPKISMQKFVQKYKAQALMD